MEEAKLPSCGNAFHLSHSLEFHMLSALFLPTYLACCLPCLGSTACQITNYSSRDKRYAFYSNISSDQYFQPQHPISVICFMCSFITPLQTALLSFLCNLPATRDYDGGAVFQIILSLIASFLHYKMFSDVFSSIKISD